MTTGIISGSHVEKAIVTGIGAATATPELLSSIG